MDERLYCTWPRSVGPEWLAACHENSKAFPTDGMLHVKLMVFSQCTVYSGREAWAANSRTRAPVREGGSLKSVLRILRCHSDIQRWSGRGALLRYCAAYVTKCKLAWDALALAEGVTVWTQASTLLRSWKATVAEMALSRQPLVFGNFLGIEYRPILYTETKDRELHLYRP